MIPFNGTYEHLFTAKFSEGLIIVPSEATHFIISSHRSSGNSQSSLNHATIRVLIDGVINPFFDCIVPAGEFISLLFKMKGGVSAITYSANNTEPEIASFYKYQINRRIQ